MGAARCFSLRGVVPRESLCVGVDLLCVWGVAGNCSGCVVVRSCRRCGCCCGGGYSGAASWKFVPGYLFGWLSGVAGRQIRPENLFRMSVGTPAAFRYIPFFQYPLCSLMPRPDAFRCVFWRLPGCSECMPAVWCPYDADFSAPARIFEQAIVFMYIFAGRRQTIT